jgi:hypothetical protein
VESEDAFAVEFVAGIATPVEDGLTTPVSFSSSSHVVEGKGAIEAEDALATGVVVAFAPPVVVAFTTGFEVEDTPATPSSSSHFVELALPTIVPFLNTALVGFTSTVLLDARILITLSPSSFFATHPFTNVTLFSKTFACNSTCANGGGNPGTFSPTPTSIAIVALASMSFKPPTLGVAVQFPASVDNLASKRGKPIPTSTSAFTTSLLKENPIGIVGLNARLRSRDVEVRFAVKGSGVSVEAGKPVVFDFAGLARSMRSFESFGTL